MNYKRLIDDLKHYATRYASGATLGRMIVETDDLMFQAAEVIESLTKADSWTLVEDKLPPNEEEVLLCVEMRCQPEIAIRSIVGGIYTDGKHYNTRGRFNFDEDGAKYDKSKDAYIIPKGWWEITGDYIIYNEVCKDIEKIDGTIIAWMPLPEMPRIKEMRQK